MNIWNYAHFKAQIFSSVFIILYKLSFLKTKYNVHKRSRNENMTKDTMIRRHRLRYNREFKIDYYVKAPTEKVVNMQDKISNFSLEMETTM